MSSPASRRPPPPAQATWQPERGPFLPSGVPRFEIERTLGEGGMGVVYLAFDRAREMRVAVKTLRDDEPGNLARFKREFRALAELEHRNLVGLYELFSEDGAWFFTMEPVDGVRFDQEVCGPAGMMSDDDLPSTRIETRDASDMATEPAPVRATARLMTTPSPERLAGALLQLTDALDALHGAGIVHCDVKPSNVLVTHDGRVVLLDFGLARDLHRHEASAHVEGTPHYLAPELLWGEAPTPSSDWYAVGVMLFRALTGRLPILGRTSRQLSARALGEELPSVGALAPQLPIELVRLVDGLLAGAPSERLGSAAVRAYLAGASSFVPAGARAVHDLEPAFVGREPELAVLERSLQSAGREGPHFVVVRGASGIGKSALLAHFGDRVTREGRGVVLASRCYEREQVPFKALDGLVDAIAAHLAARHTQVQMSVHVAALAVLFPVLRSIPGIAAMPVLPSGMDPSAVRAMAAEAIPLLLGRIAEPERPFVFLVDDVQWSDADSAALMEEAMSPSSRTPVLFVVSTRSSGSDNVLIRALQRRALHLVELDLDVLAPDESVRLARSLDVDDAEGLARDGHGVPFFTVELARWKRRARRSMPAPSSLDELIDVQLAQLAPDTRTLLELAALAGIPLSASVLAKAAGLLSDPLPHLRSLSSRSLLRATSHADEHETYHDRVRETTTARLSPERRQELHTALGRVLAAQGDADPELVASHLVRGAQPERAAPFLIAAATRASAALAFDHAVSLYELALEHAPLALRVERSLQLAEALVLAGRSADAAARFAELARDASGEQNRAHARRRAAAEWLKCGVLDRGLYEVRSVLREVGLRYPDSQLEAFLRTAVRIVRIRGWDGRFERRDVTATDATLLARADAARATGVGLMMVDPLRGYGFLAQFLLDARRSGDPRRVAAALALNAVTVVRTGRSGYARAWQWLTLTRAIASELDDDYLRGLADSCEAGVRICTGEWSAVVRLGSRATPLLRSTQTSATWEITATDAVTRAALYFTGQLQLVGEACGRDLRAAEAVGDRFAATFARVHRWVEPARVDEIDRGRRELADALAGWSSLGFHPMHWWALYGELQYDLYEGKPEAAEQRLQRVWPALEHSRMLQVQVYRVWLTATHATLLLALSIQLHAAKIRALAGQLEGEDLGYASAFAAFVRARLWRETNPDRARRESSRAATLFERADMPLHASAARVVYGELSGSRAGREARDELQQRLRERGVRRPERWMVTLGV